MWNKTFIVIILMTSGYCLHQNAVKFSIEYFSYREIKFVCLLNCGVEKYWSHHFAKRASHDRIAVGRINISGVNITKSKELKMCLDQTFTSVGVLINSKCNGFAEIMNFASKNKMFDSMHKWLIIDDIEPIIDFNYNAWIPLNESTTNKSNIETDFDYKFEQFLNTSDTLSIVERLNTSVDSDIIIISSKEDFGYDIHEVLNFGKIQGGNLTRNYIGSWNKEPGLMLFKNLNSYKYYDRWDFQQWTMRMIVVYINPPERIEPEMIIGRVVPSGVAHITQTSAMALHVVAERHNFRYTYTAADRWIGPYKPENTMIVVSALHYEYQDISPLIRLNAIAWGTIDVVHPPLTSLETKYFYRIPTFGPGKFENQFLRPLTTGVWLCVMAASALCALVILLAAKLEQRPMPAQYAVFSVIASFCQQFFDDPSQTRIVLQARRIALFVTGISCVLIYNYYTSSVVSWLLNGPPPSINSLEELLESPLKLIFEDIGYTRSWLQTPDYYYNKKNKKVEDEMRKQKVFNKKKDEPLLVPPDEGIDMVKSGGYAYHTEATTANMLISRKFTQMELCELGSLQSMDKSALYAAVQKKSPYKEFFVWSLARLSERGVISCIQRRTSVAAISCEGSSPRALALGGAAPAFLLLLFGYLLATAIMLLERILHKYLSVK